MEEDAKLRNTKLYNKSQKYHRHYNKTIMIYVTMKKRVVIKLFVLQCHKRYIVPSTQNGSISTSFTTKVSLMPFYSV